MTLEEHLDRVQRILEMRELSVSDRHMPKRIAAESNRVVLSVAFDILDGACRREAALRGWIVRRLVELRQARESAGRNQG
jgi:hypothetical protein